MLILYTIAITFKVRCCIIIYHIYCSDWRKKKGWTQEELAIRAEIGPSTIGEIETYHKRPKFDEVVKIANALGITVEQLQQKP
ncbi:MAG: Helix-turn-helix domain [Firmicutes bacterium]|nr:Helix-turn-helix domain [Bacillota bacterium]